MKHIFALLLFVTATSCVRKVEVPSPEFIRTERYSYLKDESGRLFIVTTNTKDFDQAVKEIGPSPGPTSVDKLNLWVITPLGPAKKKGTH